MKNPYLVIIQPHISERTMALAFGDPKIKDEKEIVRKYTYIVDNNANKIDIKFAFEAIFNEGRKDDRLTVESVRTVKVRGKARRRGKNVGYEPDRKKAIITLGKGQYLEEYGV